MFHASERVRPTIRDDLLLLDPPLPPDTCLLPAISAGRRWQFPARAYAAQPRHCRPRRRAAPVELRPTLLFRILVDGGIPPSVLGIASAIPFFQKETVSGNILFLQAPRRSLRASS